jgi:hypothetical protein
VELCRIIEIKQSVFEDNDRQAEALRQRLKTEKISSGDTLLNY